MSAPQPDKDSVRRYGMEAATEYTYIRTAQNALLSSFDALACTYTDHASAAESAWAFDYLWGLLDERRKATLGDSAASGAGA